MFNRSAKAFADAFKSAGAMLAYVAARFREPSTYAGLIAAIAGAAALEPPYSYATMAVGLMSVLFAHKPKGGLE